jgi:hypothetical protein
MATNLITQDQLKSLLTYDPSTGKLFNKVTRNTRAQKNCETGTVNTNGYVVVTIDGKKHLAHRLIWLMMTGSLPPHEIDHINRNRSDNAWSNLRAVTRLENSWNTGAHKNSKSGHKGVAYVSKSNKWQVQLRVRGKTHYIGQYFDVMSALAAREEAEKVLYANS